ncbi:MAG: secretion protein HlyD, partial [Pirellulales bacterium]|nr:secretion protein HlyD [Pirellulales bacterium]
MRQPIIIIATVVLLGTSLLLIDQGRRSRPGVRDSTFAQPASHTKTPARTVRAAGQIQGRTEAIELRARVSEQIQQIHVRRGQWVAADEVLISLDAGSLAAERDLAAALLAEAEAKKERLENGHRQSEIETARQEYRATTARVAGAEKAYNRALKLSLSDAVSQQTVDDLLTDLNSARATSAAAKSRLETLEAPPRHDDLLAANAAVRAAMARLKIAEVNLQRSQIRAPSSGRILSVEGERGELTGPDSSEPLVIM